MNNIVNNIERCWQQNIVQCCFHQPTMHEQVLMLFAFCRVVRTRPCGLFVLVVFLILINIAYDCFRVTFSSYLKLVRYVVCLFVKTLGKAAD